MTPAAPVDDLTARIERGEGPAVILVAGDLVLAEGAARRLAVAWARRAGAEVESHRRPTALGPLLRDLQTYSLFGGGKVVLALDTAVLADQAAAAELVAEALEALPLGHPQDLSADERQAASRLLQAFHIFGIDPWAGDAERALAALPDRAFAGKSGRGGKAAGAKGREALLPLLEAARATGLQGVGQHGVGELADAVRRGLPAGHALVLAERGVAAGHPLVARLREAGALVEVERVSADRKGWSGLEALTAELSAETGVTIRRDALEELARRTLRQEGRGGEAEADSTSRLAGEYRKLAGLAGGAAIDRALVEREVEDRGEEDVWSLLDALGEGRAPEALARLHRLVASADDPMAARLSFLSLVASFCRQLVAVRGLVDRLGLPTGERSYPRFKDRLAPALARPLPEGEASPVAGLHPFRLHRAYLAAGRLDGAVAAELPWRVLELEMAVKGETTEPDAALAAFVTRLCAAMR